MLVLLIIFMVTAPAGDRVDQASTCRRPRRRRRPKEKPPTYHLDLTTAGRSSSPPVGSTEMKPDHACGTLAGDLVAALGVAESRPTSSIFIRADRHVSTASSWRGEPAAERRLLQDRPDQRRGLTLRMPPRPRRERRGRVAGATEGGAECREPLEFSYPDRPSRSASAHSPAGSVGRLGRAASKAGAQLRLVEVAADEHHAAGARRRRAPGALEVAFQDHVHGLEHQPPLVALRRRGCPWPAGCRAPAWRADRSASGSPFGVHRLVSRRETPLMSSSCWWSCS